MLRISLVLRLICAAFAIVGTTDIAVAAKKTTFANGPISVRLCPARCLEVKRHPYKSGQTATVYETRGGWARVSEHIDPKRLSAFGNRIPAKPAFWVRTRQLANAEISVEPVAQAAEKQAEDVTPTENAKVKAKKPKRKRSVQRRRVTLPRFRPETMQVAALADATTPVAPSVEQPSPVIDPAAKQEPVVEVPQAVKPAVEGEKQEERLVQGAAKPATQKAETVAPAVTEVVPKTEPKPAKIAAKVEDKVAYTAPKAPTEETVAKPADVKPEAEMSPKTPEGVQTLTAADKFVTPSITEGDKGEPAKDEAKLDAPKVAETAPETKTAEPVKEEVKPTDEVNVASLEPKPEVPDVVPLETEERPKTYTKALRDKRLRKLPGSKDERFKIEEVIALRHHALMLLKNKECSGIVGGGRTVGQTGMMFVVCNDDPTYLRQFPLEEQTW